MDGEAWLGLGLGVVIGVVCGLWQAHDLRRSGPAGPRGGVAVGAALRLVLLVGALWAAYQFAGANRYWLVGGVAVAYGAVFGWTLKQMLAKKK